MSKKCAYCDQPGKLTREHVWPDCFLEREGREAAHFSVATQSVHGADYVVKNVCQQLQLDVACMLVNNIDQKQTKIEPAKRAAEELLKTPSGKWDDEQITKYMLDLDGHLATLDRIREQLREARAYLGRNE